MARNLRFERTDDNDYLVTSDSKKMLAVIRPHGKEWHAMLPQANGGVLVNDVAMATVAVGRWQLAVSIVMERLLLKEHGGWA